MNPWDRCDGCGEFRWCHSEAPPFRDSKPAPESDPHLYGRVIFGLLSLVLVFDYVAAGWHGEALLFAALGAAAMLWRRPR